MSADARDVRRRKMELPTFTSRSHSYRCTATSPDGSGCLSSLDPGRTSSEDNHESVSSPRFSSRNSSLPVAFRGRSVVHPAAQRSDLETQYTSLLRAPSTPPSSTPRLSRSRPDCCSLLRDRPGRNSASQEPSSEGTSGPFLTFTCSRDIVGDKRSRGLKLRRASSSSKVISSSCPSPHLLRCLESCESDSCLLSNRSDTTSSSSVSSHSSRSVSRSPLPRTSPPSTSPCGGGRCARLVLLACGALLGLVCGLVTDAEPLSSPGTHTVSFCPSFHMASSSSPYSLVFPLHGSPLLWKRQLIAAFQLLYPLSLSLPLYRGSHSQEEDRELHTAEQHDMRSDDSGRGHRTGDKSCTQDGRPSEGCTDLKGGVKQHQEGHGEKVAGRREPRETALEDKWSYCHGAKRNVYEYGQAESAGVIERPPVPSCSESYSEHVSGDDTDLHRDSSSTSFPCTPPTTSSSSPPSYFFFLTPPSSFFLPTLSSFPELVANLSWLFMIVSALLPKRSIQESHAPSTSFLSQSAEPGVSSLYSSLRPSRYPGLSLKASRKREQQRREGDKQGSAVEEQERKRRDSESETKQGRLKPKERSYISMFRKNGEEKLKVTAVRKGRRSSVEIDPLVYPGFIESISLFFLSFSCSFFMAQSLFGCGPLLLQLEGLYLLLVTTHHLTEYLFVFYFHPDQLSIDSFLLNNTPVYACAILLSVCELRAKPRLFPHFFRSSVGPDFTQETSLVLLTSCCGSSQRLVPWKNLLVSLLHNGSVNLIGGSVYTMLSLMIPEGFLETTKGHRGAGGVDGKRRSSSERLLLNNLTKSVKEQDLCEISCHPGFKRHDRILTSHASSYNQLLPTPSFSTSSSFISNPLAEFQRTHCSSCPYPIGCTPRPLTCCSLAPFSVFAYKEEGERKIGATGVCLRDDFDDVMFPSEADGVVSLVVPFVFLLSFLLGLVLAASGLFLRLLAFVTARENFTHKIAKKKLPSHHLITHGVYGVFRHPAYTGWFYWAVGSQFLLGNVICVLLFAGLSFRFFLERIVYEERLLEQMFPREYAAYRRDTPRLGIPFLQRAVTRWQLDERRANHLV
ncbi:isoprenylcysteine carboxyl methyltransferase family protein [Cystoisospora suis]|uniref:Protein-S-isoprenylcysteine O-methyltransferase n=1 Tax=Cystoisospora suis TaxID=483139 RepID=A0A2C6L5Q9_9APIC|nr:isoprenylcysteine carboxyl methyltransferase family protein [Cystoisospora suis]